MTDCPPPIFNAQGFLLFLVVRFHSPAFARGPPGARSRAHGYRTFGNVPDVTDAATMNPERQYIFPRWVWVNRTSTRATHMAGYRRFAPGNNRVVAVGPEARTPPSRQFLWMALHVMFGKESSHGAGIREGSAQAASPILRAPHLRVPTEHRSNADAGELPLPALLPSPVLEKKAVRAPPGVTSRDSPLAPPKRSMGLGLTTGSSIPPPSGYNSPSEVHEMALV